MHVYECYGLMFIPAKRHEQVLGAVCVSFDRTLGTSVEREMDTRLNYVRCMRASNM
jgi:hypothetical protein